MGIGVKTKIWRRPTVIDLADLDDVDGASGGPPLGGAGVQQVVVLVGGALDVLPPRHGEAVGDVGDEDLYVRAREAGVEDQALDAHDEIRGIVTPPADVVEAEVQDEDVRAVLGDLGVQRLDVLPGRAAVYGEVGGAAAGGEEGRDGGVVRAPGLWVGRVDVDRVDRGGQRAVEGAYILYCWVGVSVVGLPVGIVGIGGRR